jgi:hypothetical protein
LFADVVNQEPKGVDALLRIANDPDARRRMMDAEEHHQRPALAGIVRDVEKDPRITPLLSKLRFRQLCGVVVKMMMNQMGWTTAGAKGSLAAISSHFRLAEHFKKGK